VAESRDARSPAARRRDCSPLRKHWLTTKKAIALNPTITTHPAYRISNPYRLPKEEVAELPVILLRDEFFLAPVTCVFD
jgi:hypothetical protein